MRVQQEESALVQAKGFVALLGVLYFSVVLQWPEYLPSME